MPGEHPSEIVDAQAVEWFARLRDAPVPDEVRAEFAAWRLASIDHARAYDEIVRLWAELDSIPDVGVGDGQPRSGPGAPAKARRRYWRVPAIAAATTALILAVPAWQAAMPPGGLRALLADARAPAGGERALTLPDGSHVLLDSGSALSFRVTGQERRVTLVAGRAFFDVKHETARPFIVDAANSSTRDIGTAFEVAAADGRSSVAVSSGVVEVTMEGGAAATLKAGEQVSCDERLHPVRPVAARDVAAWRSGRLVFEDMRVVDILPALERYGAGRILLLDRRIGEKRLTGAFDKAAPGEALAAIAKMAGARVLKLGPFVVLRPLHG